MLCAAVLWCVQGGAELAPFDPYAPQPKMIHKGGYQPKYFVMDSFEVRMARGFGFQARACICYV